MDKATATTYQAKEAAHEAAREGVTFSVNGHNVDQMNLIWQALVRKCVLISTGDGTNRSVIIRRYASSIIPHNGALSVQAVDMETMDPVGDPYTVDCADVQAVVVY